MQVPNGMEAGFRRSKRLLSACCTSSVKRSRIGIKSDRWTIVIVFGQATERHLAFVREELRIV